MSNWHTFIRQTVDTRKNFGNFHYTCSLLRWIVVGPVGPEIVVPNGFAKCHSHLPWHCLCDRLEYTLGFSSFDHFVHFWFRNHCSLFRFFLAWFVCEFVPLPPLFPRLKSILLLAIWFTYTYVVATTTKQCLIHKSNRSNICPLPRSHTKQKYGKDSNKNVLSKVDLQQCDIVNISIAILLPYRSVCVAGE